MAARLTDEQRKVFCTALDNALIAETGGIEKSPFLTASAPDSTIYGALIPLRDALIAEDRTVTDAAMRSLAQEIQTQTGWREQLAAMAARQIRSAGDTKLAELTKSM